MDDKSFWSGLFSPEGFMPRAICGIWDQNLIWLHNVSDFFIWTAYLAIPIILLLFVRKRRGDIPFWQLFVLFGLFIVACGTTHFMEIVMFYHPVYRLAGLIKFITAVVSWATVLALIPVVPRALAMRSPEAFQKEIEERERAEAHVRALNATLEDRVAERTAELETASRAKDEFLMTLSHELRTPLNAIQGWAALLSEGRLSGEMHQQAVDTILRNSQAQTRLVEDILEVSRIITGKATLQMKPVSPREVIENALLAVEPGAAAKSIEILRRFENEDVLVSGDAERLQQVVWNVLSNAIKFTPRRGSIEVALKTVDSRVQIEVTDSGEGIDADFLPHVFERFRQADSSSTRQHGGLGLGLAIVRHITELHGGRATANSPGKGLGTTLCISLPVRAVVSEAQPEPASANLPLPSQESVPTSEGDLQGLTILVVDDESEARDLVSTILRLRGARVMTAASASEAWDTLARERVHLLISDIGMPEENGYSLARRLRAANQFSGLPAVALTAYASKEDEATARQSGFDAHLAKPVLPELLIARIQDVLRGRSLAGA